jgi:hypothetical protein
MSNVKFTVLISVKGDIINDAGIFRVLTNFIFAVLRYNLAVFNIVNLNRFVALIFAVFVAISMFAAT